MIDLSPAHLAVVQRILAEIVPECEVRAFGSRATWLTKEHSDLDLAVAGKEPIPPGTFSRLQTAFEESLLPIRVDVVDWLRITDSFREAISSDRVVVRDPAGTEVTKRAVIAPVRDVVEFSIGGSRGREERFEDSVPVRVLRGTDFDRIRNQEYHAVPTRYENSGKVKRQTLKPGDVVLELSRGGRSGNQSTGRSLFVSSELLANLGSPVMPARSCRLIRFNGEVIEPRYAYYALHEMHSSGRASMYELQSTGISKFKFNFFLDSEYVPLPSRPVQRSIAHFLATLDKKIDLNRRIGKTLAAMSRALFKSWFVDFDPVRAKLEGRDTGLPPDIADQFPERLADSEMGEIPEGWRWSTLAELASLNPESWSNRNAPDCKRYVGLANTNCGSINDVQELTRENVPGRGCRVLRRGDTIVGTVRPGNGSHAIVDCDGLKGSSAFAVLRPAAPSARELVWCAATSRDAIARLAHLADGGARPVVKPQDVLDTPVALPDARLRLDFSSMAAPLVNRLGSVQRESRALAALRDALLPRLISGEIEAPYSGGVSETVT